jgi:3-deoxy-D-manno-octulosonate 8-phosphate phosphatase (KDO 8-P phosphatase)
MTHQAETVINPALIAKIIPIRMLLMDVDGVLTDGSIIWDDNGIQTRVFDVRDGTGVYLIRQVGIQTGIISGKKSAAVTYRAQELQIDEVHQGVTNKLSVYEAIKTRNRFSDEQFAFIGDDLLDIALLKKVGFSAAPADAHPEILKRVDFVSRYPGGKGAVREIVELILKAQNKWEFFLNLAGTGQINR